MVSRPKLPRANTANRMVGTILVKPSLCLSMTANPVSSRPATMTRNHATPAPPLRRLDNRWASSTRILSRSAVEQLAGTPQRPRRLAETGGDSAGSGWLGLRGRLQLLLEGAYLRQGVVVDDVGDRSMGSLVAVVTRGGPPARRPDTELLAEQRDEDASLLVSEPGQGADALHEVRPIGGAVPHRGRVAVESFDKHLSKRLDALCHRGRESMQRRRLTEQLLECGRVVLRDLPDIQVVAEALLQLVRRGERLLDRDLLVQQHADQQSERIVDKELVCFWCVGKVHAVIFQPSGTELGEFSCPGPHWYRDVAVRGDLGRAIVAGVDVADHPHGRVVGEHPLELLGGERGAVGDSHLPGVDG